MQDNSKMEEALIGINEAAAFLDVPRSWLYSRTRTRTVPFLKCGRYVKFRRSDLIAWLESKQEGQS